MKPKDEQVRRRVIGEFSQDLLIEAGAGTGKTTLLVERALHAILDRGIPVDRIILITFMEKAALEIRQRLTQGLNQAMATPSYAVAASRALDHLADSRITTIHGLCLHVLREFTHQAGLPIGFQILDPYDADQLWNTVWDDWIQTSREAERVLDAFLAANISLDQFRDMVRTISEWEVLPLDALAPPVDDARFQDIEDALRDWVSVAEREADPSDAARRQITQLSQFVSNRARDPWGWIRTLKAWPTAAPRGNKKGWTHPDRLAEQKAWIREELNPTIAAWQGALADYLLNQLMCLVQQDFEPFWHARKLSRGVAGFDDLLRKTRDLVRADPEVRQRIRQSFDILMVDEFQDTDPIQTEIILTLTQDRAGSLLLVGDPKQAIYRFRGADVELYAAVRQDFSQRTDARVVPITHNFRSHPAILGAVNQYFAKRFPSEPDPNRPYIPVFRPLETHDRTDSWTHLLVDGGPMGARADERRRESARRAGCLIRRAIQDKWPIYDTQERQTRPIRYRDMVLIMPTRTGLDVFDEVFAALGIPLAKESGTAFFRRDEIRGYTALLSALQNPRDEVSVAAFLLSPWVGLSLDAIRSHRDAHGLDYRGQEPDTTVGEWLCKMDRWFLAWWAIDPETLLFRVLEATQMRGTLTSRNDQAALANLDKLGYLSHHLGRSWGIDGFAQWMEEKVQQGANEEEGPLGGDLEAVHFSTVHRSKGLEWPLVIVTNWSQAAARHGSLIRGVGGTPVMKIADLSSKGWDEAIYQDGLRGAAEQQRLLYVALTRAREYLAVIDMWPENQDDLFDFLTLNERRMGIGED